MALYEIIIKASIIKHFDLFAFCILPEHLHLMAQKNADTDYPRTLEKVRWDRDKNISAGRDTCAGGYGYPTRVSVPALANISDLLYTIKSFFVKEMRTIYKIEDKIWQSRFNSRFVNTEKRFENTLNYITYNYQKHNLPEKYSKYPYQHVNNILINRQI